MEIITSETAALRDYAERMAETVRVRRKLYRENLRRHTECQIVLDRELAAIIGMCPHLKVERHESGCAEESSWDECLDCGIKIG